MGIAGSEHRDDSRVLRGTWASRPEQTAMLAGPERPSLC